MNLGKETVDGLLSAVTAGSWHSAGTLLTQLEADGSSPPAESNWLEFVMKSTGASRNTLRMMQRAAKFVDVQQDNLTRKVLIQSGLRHVDVLMRAIELDQEKGTTMLQSFINSASPQSFRELNEKYEALRAGAISLDARHVKKTRESAGAFRKACMEVLTHDYMRVIYEDIFGAQPDTLSVRVWKGAHPLTSPYATIRRPPIELTEKQSRWSPSGNGSASFVDGVECFMRYDNDEYDVARNRLLQAATESSLYDIFWLLIPTAGNSRSVFALDGEDPFKEGDFYVSLFNKLAVPNLGMIIIEPTRPMIDRVLLPSGPPDPDRRHLWNQQTRTYLA